jgi:riboflavin-specific deaminase-like protein
VLLSAAVSLDGYLDDASPERLLLSNEADFDRVDQLRAESDAIMVGAGTLRADNPRLLVRSDARRAERVRQGRPEHPIKVTVTADGDLAPELVCWHTGGAKLVYATETAATRLRLGELARVVTLGPRIDFGALLDDLGERGVHRLMVEGGGQLHTAFLSAELADELRLAVAPIVVGDDRAPRFLRPASYRPSRLHLTSVDTLGDIAVLTYHPHR